MFRSLAIFVALFAFVAAKCQRGAFPIPPSLKRKGQDGQWPLGPLALSTAKKVVDYTGTPCSNMANCGRQARWAGKLTADVGVGVNPRTNEIDSAFKAIGYEHAVKLLNVTLNDIRKDNFTLFQQLGNNGFLCCKYVSGTSIPSNHAYGLAIDLKLRNRNSDGSFGDWFGDSAGDDCIQPLMVATYPYFHRRGWFWAAGYRTWEDGPHYEISEQLAQRWISGDYSTPDYDSVYLGKTYPCDSGRGFCRTEFDCEAAVPHRFVQSAGTLTCQNHNENLKCCRKAFADNGNCYDNGKFQGVCTKADDCAVHGLKNARTCYGAYGRASWGEAICCEMNSTMYGKLVVRKPGYTQTSRSGSGSSFREGEESFGLDESSSSGISTPILVAIIGGGVLCCGAVLCCIVLAVFLAKKKKKNATPKSDFHHRSHSLTSSLSQSHLKRSYSRSKSRGFINRAPSTAHLHKTPLSSPRNRSLTSDRVSNQNRRSRVVTSSQNGRRSRVSTTKASFI